MPYLGNKPVNNFVSFAKQDITGNGGTSYSLDYPVTGANDIDLYINNVRQEPTEAYSCSGSTLTLTEAVSSSDDIYAIFRGRALQTAQHPSDSALEASQATISGEATITGNAFIGANGTAIPNANLASNLDFLQVGTGATIQAGADAQSFIKSNHYWNGSSTSFQDTSRGSTTIRLNENNAGILQFETAPSGGVGTTSRLTIDANGRVTMPSQPYFYTYSTDVNVNYNSGDILNFDLIYEQQGSNFSTANKRFTAPVQGVYSFTASVYGNSGTSNHAYAFHVNGATRVRGQVRDGTGDGYAPAAMIIKLSAGDYVDLRAIGVGVTNFYGGSNLIYSQFSGCLIG